ncbi:MAG: hypothetical protein DMF81_20810 [Acidobacteria bacterium]|nr:MAG: hypothetical protein DMF81_20810 [Acidobacteriota bacterium]
MVSDGRGVHLPLSGERLQRVRPRPALAHLQHPPQAPARFLVANVPYARYFLADILQFQFHRPFGSLRPRRFSAGSAL